MEKITLLLFFYFFLFKSISGADDCVPASCSPTEPEVRFPFRIRGRQPSDCGYPGFDLSCNEQNRTIINLTSSTSYIVSVISYYDQVIYIDTEVCVPKQIPDFRLNGRGFSYAYSSMQSYKFYNCSKPTYEFPVVTLPCLDSVDHSVIAVPTGWNPEGSTPENCQDIALIFVPIWRYGLMWEERLQGLRWLTPSCQYCEFYEDGICGPKNVNGSESSDTTCFISPAVIRRRNTVIHTFVGVVVLVFIFMCWIFCKGVKESDYNLSTHQNVHIPPVTNNRSTHQNVHMLPITIILPRLQFATGLELPTIESYKKTILGESLRLPRVDDDGCCAICLSNYKPRDALRTLPECNHYFHAVCIDEWLRLNATCPMCRHVQRS